MPAERITRVPYHAAARFWSRVIPDRREPDPAIDDGHVSVRGSRIPLRGPGMTASEQCEGAMVSEGAVGQRQAKAGAAMLDGIGVPVEIGVARRHKNILVDAGDQVAVERTRPADQVHDE